MALIAWLPIFLLQLFSAILGMDLNYLPAFRSIEVFRWQQPVCTSASSCANNDDYERQMKMLNVGQVRDYIDIEELEPSTFDSTVIYEKVYTPDHMDTQPIERHFNGRYLPENPPAIVVTRVIDSPVTATIIARNCIEGVPSCDTPTRMPVRLAEEEYVLQRTLEAVESKKQSLYDVLANKKQSVVQTFGQVAAGKHEYVQGFVEKKQQAIKDIIEEVGHKKDAVVQAAKSVADTVGDVKQSIVDKLHGKKDAIVEAVSNVAAAKHQFIEAVVQKKKDKLQPIVDVANATKDKIVGVVSSVAAAKHQKIQAIVDKVHEKKDHIVEVASSVAAAKHEFVGGIVEKKKEKIQAVVDKVNEKKDKIGEVVSSVAQAKHEFVQGIVEKKKQKIQPIVDKLQEKKDKIVEVVSNVAQAKHDFVEGIVNEKHEVLQQKKDEIVGVASSIADNKREKLASVVEHAKDKLNSLTTKKQATVQSVVDQSKRVVHEFMEAKEKAELDLAEKKQSLVQNIADKKIEAIKAISEKTQEYIGTASLIKPLMVGQIKQAFNKDEKLEEEDDDDEFTFVDGSQNAKVDDEQLNVEQQPDERTAGLLKKINLKKKFQPDSSYKEPSRVVLTNPEMEITDGPIKLKGNFSESFVSSTTQEIVNFPEVHKEQEIIASIPSAERERNSTMSIHGHEEIGSISDETSSEQRQTIAEIPQKNINTADSREQVPMKIEDTPIPSSANNETVTFGAESHLIGKSSGEGEPDAIETVANEDVNEELVSKNASVNEESLQAVNEEKATATHDDVEARMMQAFNEEILARNVDVDSVIAELIDKLIAAEKQEAVDETIVAKNVDVNNENAQAAEEVAAGNANEDADDTPTNE